MCKTNWCFINILQGLSIDNKLFANENTLKKIVYQKRQMFANENIVFAKEKNNK